MSDRFGLEGVIDDSIIGGSFQFDFGGLSSGVTNILKGGGSFFIGIGRTGRFAARRFGFLGRCEAAKSKVEGQILAEAIVRLRTDSAFRSLAGDEFLRFLAENPARVLGRVLTGSGVTLGLKQTLGPRGVIVGGLLTFSAVHGDIRSAIEAGSDDLPGLVGAIAGGLPEGVPSLFGDCGCSRQ